MRARPAQPSTPDAIGALFDEHATAVFRYASARLGAQGAEEVVADTFLAAFASRHRFDPGKGDAVAWLMGIATNCIRQYRAVEAKHYLALSASTVVSDFIAGGDTAGQLGTLSVDQRVDAERRVNRLSEELARMPDGDRDVLLLHAWADLTYVQIATALKLPVGTVRSRLNRVRRQLKVADGSFSTTKDFNHE